MATNVRTHDRHGMARYYCIILAVLLGLLPSFGVNAENTEALLTIKQQELVLGTFSLTELEKLRAVAVTLEDDSGQSSDYIGVPLAQLLQSVGVPLGESVRGVRLAEFVVVRAADGYRALFSLAEIDPIFRERTLLLCYGKNGGPLPAKEGPLRVVVADEKRHARWVRQVTAIELGRVDEPSTPR